MFVYWGNGNTKKLTGVQINLPNDSQSRKRIISYAMSAFSFNLLPTNYIEIVEDAENKDNISFIQKCFIKSGETFFTKTSTIFSTITKEVNLEELGLVKTSNLLPQILRKRTNRLAPFPVKEIEPLTQISVLSVKKRKLELDEMDLKRRKTEFFTETEAFKKQHKNLLEFEQEVGKLQELLEPYFRSHWKNFDTSGEYKVSAFTVSNKGTFPYVGVLGGKEGSKSVYYLKGFYKNNFINVYKAKENLKKEG